VGYPPHLLDELARVFARVALTRLLKESAARGPRQEHAEGASAPKATLRPDADLADGEQPANISRRDQT
jgi:hypothetical protein